MLVDLGRNDIGKISQFGSVEVERYMDVLRYPTSCNIGSTVRGNNPPRQGRGGRGGGHSPRRRCPVRQSSEPSGSSTNWRTNNGIYGGAIGYIDFTGNLTPALPSALPLKKNSARYSSAPARALWSVPESEYHQECINKAQAVVNAVKASEGRLTDMVLIDNYDRYTLISW